MTMTLLVKTYVQNKNKKMTNVNTLVLLSLSFKVLSTIHKSTLLYWLSQQFWEHHDPFLATQKMILVGAVTVLKKTTFVITLCWKLEPQFERVFIQVYSFSERKKNPPTEHFKMVMVIM